MRTDWQEYTGFGELLCFVLAWVVGIGAVWVDYSARQHHPGAVSVAVSGGQRNTTERLD